VNARQRYSSEHPDVKRLARIAANLEAELAKVQEGASAFIGKPDNPAYIEIEARLEAADAEVVAWRAKQKELRGKLASYEERLTHTPQVEREYRTLTRDYENAEKRYQEVKARQLEAQLAESLEAERKGERFTMIEPPRLPQRPVAPNRMAIALLGLFLSIGGGVVIAAVAETMDHSLHGAKAVSRLLGETPLAVIPHIRAPGAGVSRRVKYASLALVLVVTVLLILWLLTPFAPSLGVTWSTPSELVLNR
jgi:uncharacterized protein involved in exopolysaccharide biosynthesis